MFSVKIFHAHLEIYHKEKIVCILGKKIISLHEEILLVCEMVICSCENGL
jgi:hypothetical protein